MDNILPDCLSNLRDKGVYLENSLGVKEYAWIYQDVKDVLKCLKEAGFIILGGDVIKITKADIEYSPQHNWVYHYDNIKDSKENINDSYLRALEHIESLHDKYGDDYLFVIVYRYLKPAGQVRQQFREKALVHELTSLYKLEDTCLLIERLRELNKNISSIQVYDLSEGIDNINRAKNIKDHVDMTNDYYALQSTFGDNNIWSIAKHYVKNQQEKANVELGFEIIFDD